MSTVSPTFDPPSDRAPDRERARRAPSWSERFRAIGSLLKDTAVQWQEDEAARLAASLALYTLLSIAPLLILCITIAGMVLGDEAARGQISTEIGSLVGPQAGAAIEALVANAQQPSATAIGSIVGIAVLLFGASGVFGELQAALNKIWNVKPKPGRGIKGVLRDRFFSFSMVMGVAFLLLVSLVVSASVSLLTTRFEGLIPWPFLWQALSLLVAFGVTTSLFALMFKIVPDAKTVWKDAWIGALVTAFLFTAGKGLLAWYVGRSATVSPFGAAGSLVALIVWVYYSAQILFMGAEFTQVYATRYGSSIVPDDDAVPAEPRQQKGAAAGEAPRARTERG